MSHRDSGHRTVLRDFRPKPPDLPEPPDVLELPPEDDRRLLRVSLAVAALVHMGLLLLPMPWTGAAAAPEPPSVVVHTLANVRPASPEPPPTKVEPPPEPPRAEIPVPAWDVIEPAVEEALEPLPAPDVPVDTPTIVFEAPPPSPPPAPTPPDGPIHVIGAVQPPVAVDAPRPAFPEIARRVGRDGTVVVQVVIDRDGRVGEVEVLRPAPFGMTEAAVEAVKRWRFRPAELDGRPVAVYFHLTVRFTVR